MCEGALYPQVLPFQQLILAQILRRAPFARDLPMYDDVTPISDLDRLIEVLLAHEHRQLISLLQCLDLSLTSAVRCPASFMHAGFNCRSVTQGWSRTKGSQAS